MGEWYTGDASSESESERKRGAAPNDRGLGHDARGDPCIRVALARRPWSALPHDDGHRGLAFVRFERGARRDRRRYRRHLRRGDLAQRHRTRARHDEPARHRLSFGLLRAGRLAERLRRRRRRWDHAHRARHPRRALRRLVVRRGRSRCARAWSGAVQPDDPQDLGAAGRRSLDRGQRALRRDARNAAARSRRGVRRVHERVARVCRHREVRGRPADSRFRRVAAGSRRPGRALPSDDRVFAGEGDRRHERLCVLALRGQRPVGHRRKLSRVQHVQGHRLPGPGHRCVRRRSPRGLPVRGRVALGHPGRIPGHHPARRRAAVPGARERCHERLLPRRPRRRLGDLCVAGERRRPLRAVDRARAAPRQRSGRRHAAASISPRITARSTARRRCSA